ncbi:MAG: Phosphoheptose isomerase [candidate division TA06 bacterium ADurb.Bin131]|uniref:Phosphoheptose isomerase n=1 Tax=candidate division TA06 bacterium ADurb.Bin131 TaxID=1852827 RepID=A0A1V6CCB5_UNCT6|nr:MAG: Phosphoheptose isomerase [candidate division TA06 bacterium ADurb.Bin131]
MRQKNKMNKKLIEQIVLEHERIISILNEKNFQKKIEKICGMLEHAIMQDKKILVCGNGGSAADSQHIAGELVGRFQKERRPIACIALTTNTSILTSIGNDYSFDKIFSRQIEALGKRGDILLVFSTSGTSVNILEAAKTARDIGIKVISFTGIHIDFLSKISDICVSIPSESTPRIQEIHIILIHIICNIIEDRLFPHETKQD